MTVFAGAGLFAGPHDHDWLTNLRRWHDGLRATGVHLMVIAEYWEQLASANLFPDFATLRERLAVSGLEASSAPAATLAAAIVGHCRTFPSTEPIESWTATGCLASADASCDAVVRAIFEDPTHPQIAGSRLTESESLRADILWASEAGEIATVETSVDVKCYSEFGELLSEMNPLDYRDRPDVAVAIVAENMRRRGVAKPPKRFRVHPVLADQLLRADERVALRTIRVMAAVLQPKTDWPRGLDEHAITAGTAGDAPITSSAGAATRVSIKKEGRGWRLHFWLGSEAILFANLAPHDSTEIVGP